MFQTPGAKVGENFWKSNRSTSLPPAYLPSLPMSSLSFEKNIKSSSRNIYFFSFFFVIIFSKVYIIGENLFTLRTV